MNPREPRRTITEVVLLICYLVNGAQLYLAACANQPPTSLRHLLLMPALHVMAMGLCFIGLVRLENERTAAIFARVA